MNFRAPAGTLCLVITLLFAAVPAFADEPLPIEKAFERARPHLKVVSVGMKEPGDQGIDVYLKGSEIVCLNYFGANTTTTIHQQFYFEKGVPVLAVETISDLRNDRGELRDEPRVRSVERWDITPAAHGKKGRELRDHGQELLKYYRAHRKDFGENGGGED